MHSLQRQPSIFSSGKRIYISVTEDECGTENGPTTDVWNGLKSNLAIPKQNSRLSALLQILLLVRHFWGGSFIKAVITTPDILENPLEMDPVLKKKSDISWNYTLLHQFKLHLLLAFDIP